MTNRNSPPNPPPKPRPIAAWTDDAGRLDVRLYRYPENFHEYRLELRYPRDPQAQLPAPETGSDLDGNDVHVRVEEFIQPHDAFARLAALAFAVEHDRWLVHDVTNPATATRFRTLVAGFLGYATDARGDWQEFSWSDPYLTPNYRP